MKPHKKMLSLLAISAPLILLFANNDASTSKSTTVKSAASISTVAVDVSVLPKTTNNLNIRTNEPKVIEKEARAGNSTSDFLLSKSMNYPDENTRMTRRANYKDILSDDPVALCKSMREEMVNRAAARFMIVTEGQLNNLVCTYGVMAKSTPDTARTRWMTLSTYKPMNTYIDNQVRWAAFIYFDEITNKETIQLWIKTKGHGFANPDGEYGPNFSSEPNFGGSHSYVRRDYLPGYASPEATEPRGYQTLRINWGFGQAVYNKNTLSNLRQGSINCNHATLLCSPLNQIKLVTTESGDNAFFPISQSNAETKQNTISGFVVNVEMKITEKGPMFGFSGNYVNERAITSAGSIRKISHTKPTNDIRIGQLDYLLNHAVLVNQEYGKIKHSAASLPIQPNLSVRYQIDPSLRGKAYPFNFLVTYTSLFGRPNSEAQESSKIHFRVVPKHEIYNMTTGFIMLPGGTSGKSAEPICKRWSYGRVGKINTVYTRQRP